MVRRIQRFYMGEDGVIVPACTICGEPARASVVRKDGSTAPTCYGCIAEFAVPTGKRRKIDWFWFAVILALMVGAAPAYGVGYVLATRAEHDRWAARPAVKCPELKECPKLALPVEDMPEDPGDYAAAAASGTLRPWRQGMAPGFEKKAAEDAVRRLNRVSAREGAKEICAAQGGLGIDMGREIVCKFPGVDEHGWASEAAVEGWRLKVDR